MSYSSCAICGGALGQVLLEITMPDRFERFLGVEEEGYSRSWKLCEDCSGATNVHPAGVQEKLMDIAASYYEVDFTQTPGSSNQEKVRAKFEKIMGLDPTASDNAQRALRIQRFVDEFPLFGDGAKSVIDIGAGIGVFLAKFLRPGWTGIAVEPDPSAAEHLRSLEQGSLKVIEGLYEGQPEFGQHHLVTLNKVVEHIPEPVPFLRLMTKAMRTSDGVIYVEVPDRSTIDCRPPRDNALGALHYHLYDARSLTVLLERAGIVPIQVQRVMDPSSKVTVTAFGVLPEAYSALCSLFVT